MTRHASWNRRPEDPNTATGWILEGSRRFLRLRRRIVFAALGSVGALGLLIGIEGLVLGTFLAWVGLAVYVRLEAREHAALPSLRTEAFPVSVEIRRRGRRIGSENGWITFVDGWLVYEGLRTSFALRPMDAVVSFGLGTRLELRLELRLDRRLSVKVGLLTNGLQTELPARFRDGIRFDEAFERWQKLSTPEGEPVYPPEWPSPRIESERIRDHLVGAFVLVVLAILASFQSWLFGAGLGLAALVVGLDAAIRIETFRRSLALPPNVE